VVCLVVQYIPHISALWSVWLYNIFHISAHCGLSGCTIYSLYQHTVVCLSLQYIPHISALWPVWLCNMFHISVHCGLPVSTIYSTYQRTVVCLYNIFHIITQSALFSGKFIKLKLYILILCINLSVNFLILRSIQRELIKTLHQYSNNVVIILFIILSAVTVNGRAC